MPIHKTPPLPGVHNLFQQEQRSSPFLQRAFQVYPNEVKLLLWVTVIQLIMRVSSILINNFAQTAFLKRYGVESLPTIFLLEALITFFFASVVGVLMDRHRTVRVFTGLFIFFALSIGLIRGALPFGHPLIYPILYILKSQAVEILPILYWDILTDLFTTQQSKRLYTLITAGGVLGTTVGSLMTGPVARWVGADNVLLIFVGGMVLAAVLNEFTEKVVGSPIETRTDRRKGKLQGKFKENLREFIAFSKRSPLLKFMIIIIAIPNIVLPIVTYQFNVVVDAYYATEQATLQFFGIFRGVSNAVMFLALLFSGRLITHWGVATSLLFHPINYLIAFGSLFFRFDIFSGVYARFSSETLKTTLNNPARAILYNFFPEKTRGLIRVFLRGNVVRAADFTGSGFLMLIKGVMDPRFLSVVAAPLVLIWIFTNFRIKRRYSSMLLETLMEKQIDWRRLEEVDFRAWAGDKRALDSILKGLRSEDPDLAVTCGEILAKIALPGWVGFILEALPGKTPEVQKKLLGLLRPEDAGQAVPRLLSLARNASSDTLVQLIPALSRLDSKADMAMMVAFVDHPDPRVRVEALVAMYWSDEPQAQVEFRQRVEAMMPAGESANRVLAEILGRTGDPAFAPLLLSWLKGTDPCLKAMALSGLGKMGHPEGQSHALREIGNLEPRIRRAALETLMASGTKTPLDIWIRLLGDEEPVFREKASQMIRQQGEGVVQALLPVLASPSRTIRNEILSILSEVRASSVELSQFISRELKKVYVRMAILQALNRVQKGKALPLLILHIQEKNDETIEVILRVLAATEFGDKMKIIIKALQSGLKRDMDNAIEALESSLHSDIGRILIPVLEERPLDEKLALGRKRMGLDLSFSESSMSLFLALLEDEDPIVRSLTLYTLGEGMLEGVPRASIENCLEAEDPLVRDAAQWALGVLEEGRGPSASPEKTPELVDRIQFIRKVPIFRDIRVQELLAVATITTPRRCAKGELLLREGDPGDALYLIADGELSVIKGFGTKNEVVLDHIGKDDFIGEMALIDHCPRSATVRAEADSLILVIKDQDFNKILENYPAMALGVCRVFSQRIRTLHGRLRGTRDEGRVFIRKLESF